MLPFLSRKQGRIRNRGSGMVLRAKQFVNHGNTVLHCDARINGRGERRFFDYVGSNFQLQMACQGFSGPLHTTIVADPEFKPFDLQGLRAEHPSVQSFRPTRPGCLRPKGRTPFPTGKVTIAEAAARFGPQLECPVDGFAPRYASRGSVDETEAKHVQLWERCPGCD